MYYEEKIINGVLMFRYMPDADWKQCSIEDMGRRIVDLEHTRDMLLKKIQFMTDNPDPSMWA